MTRLARRSLSLILLAAPLVVVGCSGSSSNNKDAMPPDGHTAVPDGPSAPKLDASPDLAAVVLADGPIADGPIADGPVATPDVVADGGPGVPDTGLVVTPDAAVDNLVAVDRPIVSTDVPADSPADANAADGGAPADGSSDATDSSPVACEFFGGAVVSDITLAKACSPYLIRDFIQITEGAVVTIEPGVTLKFEGPMGIDVGSTNGGKLVAVGTALDPIVFTSNASPPLPGDWRAIHLWDGTMAGTRIAYAKLDYCGADRSGCIVGDGVGANLVTIDHVTIDHVGPDSDGILEYDVDSNFVITNSTFSNIPDGQYAISVQGASFAGIGANNTFNGGATIEIVGGIINSTASWVDPGTPVAVTGGLWLQGVELDNPVLTIGAGMKLMFAATNPPAEFSVGFAGPATLVIAGTSSNRVSLTSLAATPDLGDWVGLEVWGGATARISYADISYAGSDGVSGGGDLILENGNSTAQIVVDHASFTYSRGYGIYLDCAGATVTPLSTVTLNAGITYAHNESDMTNTGLPGDNVGPGLTGPDCPSHH